MHIKTLTLTCAALIAVPQLLEASQTWSLDTFDLSAASSGFGRSAQANKSADGHPLTVAGKTYAHGVGTHPESGIRLYANGKVSSFDALIGIDDDYEKAKKDKSRKAVATFKVWADGKIVWSGRAEEKKEALPVHVKLEGAKEIVLETTTVAPWIACEAANADWLDARFTGADDATLKVETDRATIAQLGILTPPEKDAPCFNGADIWGVRPGHEVIFRVPISGRRPMKLTAAPLPEGVTFDAAKGILRGTAPEKKGNYDITVTAENAAGRASRVIRLAVGDTICLTPPMGWNSWNIWGPRFTGAHARAAAEELDKCGLADYGYAYINLDDYWEMNNSEKCKRPELKGPARDASGKILTNGAFPDMKGMTDYIHSFGFKAGLYSSPGPTTCGGCEGSWGHEMQDAESWADWGFDYIKYDWCSYGDIYKKETGLDTFGPKRAQYSDSFAKPYRLMGECLRKLKRDIVYSFCQYGLGEVQKWGREAGANCWRSYQDMKDSWTWMEIALEGYIPHAEHWKYTGPGFWADPDMMIVGYQRSFGDTHPTYLTPNEQYTHVSLWNMVSSPLLVGTDLKRLDAFTKSLLMNREVIALGQDRLGQPARRVRHISTESVWTRPLSNGDVAVALTSRYPFAREIKIDFKELDIEGAWQVRDVWRQSEEGAAKDSYAAVVPAHATKLIRLHRWEAHP